MRKFLVFGAGVLGSLYAARLQQSGQDVTILAHGKRLIEISENGIELEHALDGKKESIQVPAVSLLNPEDAYDYIVVLVRKNQVPDILPLLSLNRNTPNILFMVNNPSGYEDWISAFGSNRLILGFAGAGGTKIGSVVRYKIVSGFLQPTTFGEIDGLKTQRLKDLLRVFHSAGFPVDWTPNIDAWQKTHVAWVSPLANAIYKMNGDSETLAKDNMTLHLLIRAIHEGFQGLHSAGIPVTPRKMRILELMPEVLIVNLLRFWIKTREFETVIVGHAMAASDEMCYVADEFRIFLESTGMDTPAIDELRSHIPSSGFSGNA